MAVAKTARLIAKEFVTDDTAMLRFAADEPFHFVGGQYIIVNTGIPLGDPAEGKTVKRAYSVLSHDADHLSFEVALRRIADGPGSNYMLGLAKGATLQFSGPWGKFLPQPSLSNEATGADDSAVVIATDTGITVALGLLRGGALQQQIKRTRLYWLVASDDYFVPESYVLDHLPMECGYYKRIVVPAERADREKWLRHAKNQLLDTVLSDNPKTVYLSGDGLLLAGFRDALLEASDAPPKLLIESFFHHQELKTQPTTVVKTGALIG